MDNFPVTPGYTINIIKEKKESAVILLNTQSDTCTKAFFVTIPGNTTGGGGDNGYTSKQVEFNDDFTSSGVEAVNEHFADNSLPGECFGEIDMNNIAHEEVVMEETGVEQTVNNTALTVVGVHCDLCSTDLESTDEAKLHMRTAHNILTYDGPFFKCDFCGLLVTDRVSHMKIAHYSPLAQAFTKKDNSYLCKECDYSSGQLTNIRNHVDAKHNNAEKKYLCEECNSEYKTLNSMRAHRSRVHVKKQRLKAKENFTLQCE